MFTGDECNRPQGLHPMQWWSNGQEIVRQNADLMQQQQGMGGLGNYATPEYFSMQQQGMRNANAGPVPTVENPERPWSAVAAPTWLGWCVTVANVVVWLYAVWALARQIGWLS